VRRFDNPDGGLDTYHVPDPWPRCSECSQHMVLKWVDITRWAQAPDRDFWLGYATCAHTHAWAPVPG
jgi:hypothetical protein